MRAIAIPCSIVLASGVALAQPHHKVMTAIRLNAQEMVIDGRLDEAAWQQARFVDDFTQKLPLEGGTPSDRTAIAIGYDDRAIYVAARMHASELSAIRSSLTRRDNSGSSERIIVILDPYLDRRTSYSFSLTAAGVRTDYFHPADEEFNRDYSFDAVWEGGTTIDSAGWSAEFRIPLSQLRFNEQREQVWGINVNRFIPDRNEDLYWVMIPQSESGWASRFGELRGIRGVQPTTNLELLPYVAARTYPDRKELFTTGNSMRAGLDAKLGIGSSLTLNAAFNPDFGQVEADPATINLSAFETYLDERRPFFVQGNRFFTSEGPTYFYSRRIGAPPRSPDGLSPREPLPELTPILGAAQLTGRTPGGLVVGGLVAATAAQTIAVSDTARGTFRDIEIQPVTAYGVVRLQREVPNGGTVGFIATGTIRSMQAESPAASMLSRSALAGTVDCALKPWGPQYQLRASIGGSVVSGTPASMVQLQRSSARYYQRPDADHTQIDSTRTSMAGLTAGVSLDRIEGEHWLWNAYASVETPGLELNDAGNLTSADDFDVGGTVRYRETKQGSWYRDYSVAISGFSGFNLEGVNLYSGLTTSAAVTLHNFWTASLSLTSDLPAQSDDATRGGPLMATPVRTSLTLNLGNGFSRRILWSLSSSVQSDGIGGFGWGSNGSISSVVAERVDVSVGAALDRSYDARQFMGVRAGESPLTFGDRYLFAGADVRTARLNLRIALGLTPDMSLELFGELFTAAVTFGDIGQLAAARTSDLMYYDGEALPRAEHDPAVGYHVADTVGGGFDLTAPDFVDASFRTNLVLRWEPLPGSILYLVWQQGRTDGETGRGNLRGDDLLRAVGGSGESVLALKVSYWIPIQ